MSPRGKVLERVLSQRGDEDGQFYFGSLNHEGSLLKVTKSLLAILESIPDEYRDNAMCYIYQEDDYDRKDVFIKVFYYRDETNQEYNERMIREAERAYAGEAEYRKQEEADRALYETLKKRFEGGA